MQRNTTYFFDIFCKAFRRLCFVIIQMFLWTLLRLGRRTNEEISCALLGRVKTDSPNCVQGCPPSSQYGVLLINLYSRPLDSNSRIVAYNALIYRIYSVAFVNYTNFYSLNHHEYKNINSIVRRRSLIGHYPVSDNTAACLSVLSFHPF